jgi:hypothetical protein
MALTLVGEGESDIGTQQLISLGSGKIQVRTKHGLRIPLFGVILFSAAE